MPIIKNNFLKGKMNQDLDDRLIPNGEYREAVNLKITRSDGDDVGAMQSIRSNASFTTFTSSQLTNGTLLGMGNNVNVIGFYINQGTNSFYWFVTDFTSTPQTTRAQSSNKCAILEQKEGESTPSILVQGHFLNFDSNNPIKGINMIDDLLFFTDNNNQPRKINVNLARSNGSFYSNEDHISVAKYYPFTVPRLIKQVETNLKAQSNITTASSQTLVYTYTNPSSFAIESNMTMYFIVNAVQYSAEVTSVNDDNANSDFEVTINQVKTTSDNQAITSAINNVSTDIDFTFVSNDTSMIETSDSDVDADYLKERFVKFAYRFKFVDGEYSLISPFTQACFIPEFYKPASKDQPPNLTSGGIDLDDEFEAVKSTDLQKMVNYISQLNLFIETPYSLKTLYNKLHITEVEIIMQEAGVASLRSVNEIDISTLAIELSTTTEAEKTRRRSNILKNTYKSTFPFKVLPESETVRVYDNVPIKAATQELVSNRVVYGNITLGNTPPNQVEYNLNTAERTSTDYNLEKEYPTQSLKQRRSYQVGVVFADRYGRQTSVILPTNNGRDTVFLPHNSNLGDDDDTGYDNGDGYALNVNFTKAVSNENLYSETNPLGWYSYKIVVKQVEQDYYNVYAPYLIKDFPDTNNKTWLTLHGDNVNKVPRSLDSSANPDTVLSPSEAVLYPKVINIAAGTPPSATYSNTGDTDTFTFGDMKVISIGTLKDNNLGTNSTANDSNTYANIFTPNRKFYEYHKNHLLAEIKNSYGVDDTAFSNIFYENTIQTNVSTDNATSQADLKAQTSLVVLETEPFESAIDIYYETSTSGLVSKLNEDITIGDDIANIEISNSTFPESTDDDTFTDIAFTAKSAGATDVAGATINLISITTVADPNTTINYLTIGQDPGDSNKYKLKVVNAQYYENGGNTKKYIVKVTATNSANTQTTGEFSFQVNLTNTNLLLESSNANHFSNPSLHTVTAPISAETLLTVITADNGASEDTGQEHANIEYTITGIKESDEENGTYTDHSDQGLFVLDPPNSGNLKVGDQNIIIGKYYKVLLKAKDTAITTSNPDSEYEEFDTTEWVVHANPGDSGDYYFYSDSFYYSVGNDNDDLDRARGFNALDNRPEMLQEFDAGDREGRATSASTLGSEPILYARTLGWNSFDTSETFINASLLPSNNLPPSDIGSLEFFKTYTITHTPISGTPQNHDINAFALNALTGFTDIKLLKIEEIHDRSEDGDGDRDQKNSFSNIKIWITNNEAVVNALENGTKRVKITLHNELVNIYSAPMKTYTAPDIPTNLLTAVAVDTVGTGPGTGFPLITSYNSHVEPETVTEGSGYSVANNVATTGGSGTGMTVNILSIETGGGVDMDSAVVNGNTPDGAYISNGGTGYKVGDVITISGGTTSATFTLVANAFSDSDNKGLSITRNINNSNGYGTAAAANTGSIVEIKNYFFDNDGANNNTIIFKPSRIIDGNAFVDASTVNLNGIIEIAGNYENDSVEFTVNSVDTTTLAATVHTVANSEVRSKGEKYLDDGYPSTNAILGGGAKKISISVEDTPSNLLSVYQPS